MLAGRKRALIQNALALLGDADTEPATYFSYRSTITCHEFSIPPELDTPALRRAASIMRDRRHICDRAHLQSVRLKCANSGLTARARPLDKNLQRAHTVL